LYHLVCAAMPASSANPFLAGRIVALAFMLLAVLGVLWIGKPRDWTLIVLTMGLFFLLHPVSANSAFLKNDGTALFFSVMALLMVRNGSRTALHLAGAALCCVLAVAAKQVFVSASAACFVYLLIERRQDALRFGLYCLLFASVGAAVAQVVWGNGFWWCVMHAPKMPFSPDQFTAQWGVMLRQPVFLFLIALWILIAVEYLLHRRERQLAANPFFLYFLSAGLVLLLTVGKLGSSTNYFIEPSLAGVFWIVSAAPSSLARNRYAALIAGVCLAAVLWELTTALPRNYTFANPEFTAWRADFHQSLISDAKTLVPNARPLRVLNLATASTFFDWPGETSVNDPYLYSLLWEHGVLKPDPMMKELRAQTYDLIVFRIDAALVPGDRGDGMAQIMKTLRESYRPAANGMLLQYWVRIPPNRN
jgi:hypothetical protein